MRNELFLYRRGILQLLASGFLLSTAGIALRLVEKADGWQILFYRSIALSITILIILIFKNGLRFFDEFLRLDWNDCLLAIFLGTGFVTYVFALIYNTVANALFIFGFAPFLAAFLGWLLLGERVAKRTWFAIIIAIVGLAIIVSSKLALSHYLGTLLALWIPIAYAASIIAVKRSKRDNMLVALCLAGLVALCLSAFFVTDYTLTSLDMIISLYLGVFQVGFGFTLVVLGSRYVPAAQVGLLALIEPILAPFWVWMGVGETPGISTIIGGVIIFLAIGTDCILSIKKSHSNLL